MVVWLPSFVSRPPPSPQAPIHTHRHPLHTNSKAGSHIHVELCQRVAPGAAVVFKWDHLHNAAARLQEHGVVQVGAVHAHKHVGLQGSGGARRQVDKFDLQARRARQAGGRAELGMSRMFHNTQQQRVSGQSPGAKAAGAAARHAFQTSLHSSL